MTADSLATTGQSHLTDAFLWLVGSPLCLLDALYLSHLAPPLSADRPETLVVWVLGIAALLLLAWSLLCSACAHVALLRVAPPAARSRAFLRLPLRHPSLAVASGTCRSRRVDRLGTRHRSARRCFPRGTSGTDLPRRLTDMGG